MKLNNLLKLKRSQKLNFLYLFQHTTKRVANEYLFIHILQTKNESDSRRFFSLRKFSGEMLKKIGKNHSEIFSDFRNKYTASKHDFIFCSFSFIPKSNISIHSSLSFTYKESYKENKQKYIESYTTLHTVL